MRRFEQMLSEYHNNDGTVKMMNEIKMERNLMEEGIEVDQRYWGRHENAQGRRSHTVRDGWRKKICVADLCGRS